MEEVEALELVRSALSEGRRGMVEAWLRVGKLQLGGGLVNLLRAEGFHAALGVNITFWHPSA